MVIKFRVKNVLIDSQCNYQRNKTRSLFGIFLKTLDNNDNR